MKLKFILLSLVIAISYASSATIRSRQLFDVVSKELDTNKKAKSIFSINEKKESNIGSKNKKNLFDTLNFNQIKEKALSNEGIKTTKENSSLFDKLQTNIKNSNTISTSANAKIKNAEIIKVGSSPRPKKSLRASKINTNSKEIQSLKKKVNVLLEMNEKLMSKFKKVNKDKKSKKKFNKNVVNFIEKYDQDVNSLKKNIESSKHLVEHKIVKKDEEFKKLYKKSSQEYEQLQSQVHQVGNKLAQLATEEHKKLQQLQSNLTLKDLTVEKKLEVEGVAFINKINTRNVDLGNIKVEPNQITFLDENSKIILGKDVITVGQLSKNMKTFEMLMEKCGANFEKCKPVSQNLFREQASKQQEILESLKRLRADTSKVLTSHRRFR